MPYRAFTAARSAAIRSQIARTAVRPIVPTRTVYQAPAVYRPGAVGTIYRPGGVYQRPGTPYRSGWQDRPTWHDHADWSRERNERERYRLEQLQQTQYEQYQRQMATAQQTSQILNQQPQQVATSPGAPSADLTPAQDAGADAGAVDSGAGGEHPHSNHKMLLFGGIAVAVLVGAGVLMHKKKSAKS